MHKRAAYVAAEIPLTLKDYTVHDVTHLDALWHVADDIRGPDYDLTPTEAFVLGASFLVHDLGMGLAAYAGGIEEVKRHRAWPDMLAGAIRRTLGRPVTPSDFAQPPPGAEAEALILTLRELHAEKAAELAQSFWTDRSSGERHYLLEDSILRQTFGPLIGRIAYSHWWPIERVDQEFQTTYGAPAGYPKGWTVDPLRLACLLRVSDAAHLTAERAPGFLRLLRNPSGDSQQHWAFQEHLHQPRINGDRLQYTSARPFTVRESAAWWLCFETLRMVDLELRSSAHLLADSNRKPFKIIGVDGVESAEELRRYVLTDKWFPVDANIRVGNVAKLAQTLGGDQLYGREYDAPVRELIQNGADAVRALRLLRNKGEEFGEIRVHVGTDVDGEYLEVADNGIGMSQAVLTGPLLDFGKSFWGTEQMRREIPGLIARGFEPAGKYGIGFFSVFMLGDRVMVKTRRYDAAQADTLLLDFTAGLNSRPILRDCEPLWDSGTTVRVYLANSARSENGILSNGIVGGYLTLRTLCERLAPVCDVRIIVQEESQPAEVAVDASDWRNLPPDVFLKRCERDEMYEPSARYKKALRLARSFAPNMRFITEAGGAIVGRACLMPEEDYYSITAVGQITAGGFAAAQVQHLGGVLLGLPTRAARDQALPLATGNAMRKWIDEQVDLIDKMKLDSEIQKGAAALSRSIGGSTGQLQICYTSQGHLSLSETLDWLCCRSEVIHCDRSSYSLASRYGGKFDLLPNALVTESSVPSVLNSDAEAHWFSDQPLPVYGTEEAISFMEFHNESLLGLIVVAMARAWNTTVEDIIAASQISDDDNDYSGAIGTRNGSAVVVEHSLSIFRTPHSS